MVIFAVVLFIGIVVVLVSSIWAWYTLNGYGPDALEELGVRPTYPNRCLPTAKIDSYYELKDTVKEKYAKDARVARDGDVWMSTLPCQAKDALKYKLMQRAIADMSALQKIDIDARGYWRLFSKGIISKQFWSSVMEAEKELSMELESVKAEARSVEPTQDPQGIISEAMQFVIRYGDKLPSADDLASSADAVSELMKHLPPAGHPALSQLAGAAAAASAAGGLPPLPPGMPGMPSLPAGFPGAKGDGKGLPGMPPFGGKGGPAMPPREGGGEAYKWKQDLEEIEVSVTMPATASKAEVKVVMQSRSLKVEHKGVVILEGQLAGVCRPEESTWTLSKGTVVVTLEKGVKKPWPALLAADAAAAKTA